MWFIGIKVDMDDDVVHWIPIIIIIIIIIIIY